MVYLTSALWSSSWNSWVQWLSRVWDRRVALWVHQVELPRKSQLITEELALKILVWSPHPSSPAPRREGTSPLLLSPRARIISSFWAGVPTGTAPHFSWFSRTEVRTCVSGNACEPLPLHMLGKQTCFPFFSISCCSPQP